MQPTVTQTGYLGNLLAEHQKLLHKIEDLRTFWHEVCELGIGPKCQELADRVADTREHLQRHFDAEERDGYLAPALARAPHYARQAEELRAQHVTLLKTLDELGSRLRSGSHQAWKCACAEIDAFVRELETHEHRENDIVQSAFNEEPGAGD